ncbi:MULTISPECIES: UbiD family decarboxylase [unclassified Paenibacillus]|uniref:UbiD family decarboxylase n=1 Tax=unclassified Paenibacillus TaxID=185978 RepID=UPI0024050470|nr:MULTISPECIES: UbiD family decarboxylase [unclassified Paenibacillus]MDF9842285.1 4-hydroxy-3-polyprenylbenzoate decarboxylase [Paenibacillus sp. PastF-2]MDF9848838.1 4-hydroxy-3-polyprenylbenzoate decarboxylase [Paenibacillus sp. PastM-2]MDF9855408.1 4-hydroxy-3-polyprenylbenzoate decarboxylase [Paenibacillus sp. PastF-1]MDH6480716.1 4-hydroxy-3-polyprenylbenzoate decarboxylase [Paenibacillus sp. PastH-2]MDH6508103.1 4-hydroxy-3-polyprenylbenzoate decarboxylase [Paenibacillus sp. PastM-3]
MTYRNLEECITDLEKHGHLIRITEEVDPHLEMAAIHMKVYEAGGPALLFEKVKGSKYRAVSNLFGTIERSKFIFRDTWESSQSVIALRDDPMKALKAPFKYVGTGLAARKALPLKLPGGLPPSFEEIQISELPQIKHWQGDGGAFVTLPQVYSEDPDKPGIMNSNLGMYRIQLSGNDYEINKEVGVHYQIHRGIGIHQSHAVKRGEPLKVSCFIGGPPAHTLSAVMPLPEGLSEMTFAGLIGGRHFRYSYVDGFCVSADADFVITGEIHPGDTKPEGPFGDHLGYYSLTHPFPVMKVHKVYAKKGAIFPFTVVGRPPQEDTAFGELIHELTGSAIKNEVPGVKEVHAVDAAGVHPLLFAIGSERYTPYQQLKQPAELLTIANRVLGTGQLSLAKYLFITAEEDRPLSTHNIPGFLTYILERIDLRRDIHFQTNTTIDTLDYSGTGINTGSKVVFAAVGDKKRNLCTEVPEVLASLEGFGEAKLVLPGIVALQGPAFTTYEDTEQEMSRLSAAIEAQGALPECPMIILCDDSRFISEELNNFLWATFTRSNPSHDIHGVNSRIVHKHWACDNVIIDARVKPHQAPPLIPDPDVQRNIERVFAQGGSLSGIRK